MAQVKYRGVPFEVSKEADESGFLIVPPLNCRQLRELTADLKNHDDMPLTDMVGIAARREIQTRVVHTALTRNYPIISLDEVEQEFDARTLQRGFQAAIGLNTTGQWVRDTGEIRPVEEPSASASSASGTGPTLIGPQSTGA